MPIVGTIFKKKLIQSIYTIYEASTTFIEVAEETIEVFKSSFPLFETHRDFVLREVEENLQEAVTCAFDL